MGDYMIIIRVQNYNIYLNNGVKKHTMVLKN
jgi:hypothetical protein